MAPIPRVGRGVRQARRRPVGRGRSPRARRISARRCARSPTDGPDAFYTGWIADRIADDMAANGGLITKDGSGGVPGQGAHADPRHVSAAIEIISMPPPSSGGVALIEMLNILEALRPQAEGALARVEALHLMTEAMRRAYLDRARYLGDPDFVEGPGRAADLASRTRAQPRQDDRSAAGRRAASTSARTSSPPRPARSRGDDALLGHRQGRHGRRRTPTRSRAATARTSSSSGTGILLNNEMGDFNKKPGDTNADRRHRHAANLIAPGKRMLSSMTPTIVARRTAASCS